MDYSIFDGFMDGILVTDSKNLVLYANESVASVLGLKSLKKILKKDLTTALDFFEPITSTEAEEQMVYKEIMVSLEGSQKQTHLLVGVKLIVGATNKLFYLRDLSTELGLAEKFTNERRELARVSAKAEIDVLTGCLNRAGLMDRMKSSWEQATIQNINLCLAVLDLDGFKAINDNHGHSAGDLYLTAAAAVLKKCLRSRDQVARMGGDEFVFLLWNCDREQSKMVSERVLNGINRLSLNYEGKTLKATASIGVCWKDPSFKSPTEMFENADASAYIAKKSGKNAICIYPDKSTIQITPDTGST